MESGPRDRVLFIGIPLIQQQEIAEVVHSLRTVWAGIASKVDSFVEALGDYIGVDEAVAVILCTAAPHLFTMVAAGLVRADQKQKVLQRTSL
jgi:dTDP-4-amino-4,6-dideoxygalactose transaminase